MRQCRQIFFASAMIAGMSEIEPPGATVLCYSLPTLISPYPWAKSKMRCFCLVFSSPLGCPVAWIPLLTFPQEAGCSPYPWRLASCWLKACFQEIYIYLTIYGSRDVTRGLTLISPVAGNPPICPIPSGLESTLAPVNPSAPTSRWVSFPVPVLTTPHHQSKLPVSQSTTWVTTPPTYPQSNLSNDLRNWASPGLSDWENGSSLSSSVTRSFTGILAKTLPSKYDFQRVNTILTQTWNETRQRLI